jgi:hypothetical protein
MQFKLNKLHNHHENITSSFITASCTTREVTLLLIPSPALAAGWEAADQFV